MYLNCDYYSLQFNPSPNSLSLLFIGGVDLGDIMQLLAVQRVFWAS